MSILFEGRWRQIQSLDKPGGVHDPRVSDLTNVLYAHVAGHQVIRFTDDSVGEEIVVLAVIPDLRQWRRNSGTVSATAASSRASLSV